MQKTRQRRDVAECCIASLHSNQPGLREKKSQLLHGFSKKSQCPFWLIQLRFKVQIITSFQVNFVKSCLPPCSSYGQGELDNPMAPAWKWTLSVACCEFFALLENRVQLKLTCTHIFTRSSPDGGIQTWQNACSRQALPAAWMSCRVSCQCKCSPRISVSLCACFVQ